MRSIDRRLLLTSAVLAAATMRALHPELAKRVVTTDPRMGHGQLESIGAMTLILRTARAAALVRLWSVNKLIMNDRERFLGSNAVQLVLPMTEHR